VEPTNCNRADLDGLGVAQPWDTSRIPEGPPSYPEQFGAGRNLAEQGLLVETASEGKRIRRRRGQKVAWTSVIQLDAVALASSRAFAWGSRRRVRIAA
jgi:hypothetical protein